MWKSLAVLNNFNGVHMFGLHGCDHGLKTLFAPFLTGIYSINNLKEKKEIPSFDRESNKSPFLFTR